MNEQTIIKITSTSFKVRNIDGGYKTFSIEDIFNVDETDISKEYMQQASLYGYFATLMATAEDISNRASFSKEQEYAAADTDARASMDRNGMKYTESVIRSMAISDEQYSAAVERANVAEYDYKLLKAIVRALEQRAEMLVSLGSHLRHEASMTGMTIKEREYDNTLRSLKSTLDSKKSVRKAER